MKISYHIRDNFPYDSIGDHTLKRWGHGLLIGSVVHSLAT